MNEGIRCINNKGKTVNGTFDFFRALYRAIKNRAILFPYLLINLFKQRYISTIKSYNYLK